MLKKIIQRVVERLYPELADGSHLPRFAVVTAVPDPPRGGEKCDEFIPKYAVDCRLLDPRGQIDEDMPLMRDVPVAMSGAASDRGFALLPQPGTVVEIAFAYGLQTKPYIRSVLPYNQTLPAIDDLTMRWQQTANQYQEVDAAGNWTRTTPADILDQCDNQTVEILTDQSTEIGNDQNIRIGGDQSTEIDGDREITVGGETIVKSGQKHTLQSPVINLLAQMQILEQALMSFRMTAPKIHLGSDADNFLKIVSDFMATCIELFTIDAKHTHIAPSGTTSGPQEADDMNDKIKAAAAEKARTDAITM